MDVGDESQRGRPELVLPGFPKCGSTTLYDWLTTHPHVVGARVKEPHFFHELDRSYKRREAGLPTVHVEGLESYASLWDASPTSIRIDGTPFYAFYPTARAALTDDSVGTIPLAVMIVRRPGDRVLSLYRALQNRAGRLGHDVGFDDFVARVRSADPELVEHDLQVRDCIAHSDYRRWIEPWIAAAGPDRVIVTTLDQLRDEPAAILGRIAASLDIDPGGFADTLPAANVTASVRSVRIARLRRVVGRQRWIGRLGPLRSTLRRGYERINLTSALPELTPAELAALEEIDDELAPSTTWLRDELGLPVAPWLERR